MTVQTQTLIPAIHQGAMLCRAAYQAPATATAEVMYMPAGLQAITPSQGGRRVQVQVRVDRAGAAALETQRAKLEARGKRAYFDFNHEDGEASFWPEEFFWVGDGDGKRVDGKWETENGRAAGIYARGEWSDLGQQAIAGKRYRQFSPVFYVDDVGARPARIVAREATARIKRESSTGFANGASLVRQPSSSAPQDLADIRGAAHFQPVGDPAQ
ncbi:MAG: phage protease [Chthoniobacter sp.]|uniref:phage protease n=1 Tax=Chthoniobacter sp. TaxID=2510640 RepID=UPI0032A2EEA8